ncbi:hypothetical protein ACF1GW_16205 [Streptomyces achromogenes]
MLCVRTSAGDIARPTLTELDSDGIPNENRAVFDAVVWNAG